jgi:hypothetical protein
VVYEVVITPPAIVMFGPQVADDVVVSGAAVVFVLAKPVVGIAVTNIVVSRTSAYRIGTGAAAEFIIPVAPV